ncbi:MAG: GHKL domain-containing protein [SAR202 cluster bacterium]|nr:GHKL domain-containing protein [SAR202 cluster bacterium]
MAWTTLRYSPPDSYSVEQLPLRLLFIAISTALMLRVVSRLSRERERAEGATERYRELNEQMEQRVAQRTAELQAANKELEAFSYSVSHDLRAPLRSMDGFSQALLEDYGEKLDTQGKDYLRRVRSASQQMALLVDDLLTLSRVTRSEIKRERVDLSALARMVGAELQKMQPSRQAQLVIANGVTAQGDPVLLRALLENLLSNAWKFISKHPRARIEFNMAQQGDSVVYFVKDDGAGFDMAYADKLFSPFQRLHRKDEFDGTGIGQATVQRIVNRHGGQIWAEAAPERGATFFSTLR